MKATRSLLAAMVLATTIGAAQANAQCSGNAGTCNTTNTASVTVGALVKLGMSSNTTALTNPTADQVDAGTALGIVARNRFPSELGKSRAKCLLDPRFKVWPVAIVQQVVMNVDEAVSHDLEHRTLTAVLHGIDERQEIARSTAVGAGERPLIVEQ